MKHDRKALRNTLCIFTKKKLFICNLFSYMKFLATLALDFGGFASCFLTRECDEFATFWFCGTVILFLWVSFPCTDTLRPNTVSNKPLLPAAKTILQYLLRLRTSSLALRN